MNGFISSSVCNCKKKKKKRIYTLKIIYGFIYLNKRIYNLFQDWNWFLNGRSEEYSAVNLNWFWHNIGNIIIFAVYIKTMYLSE